MSRKPDITTAPDSGHPLHAARIDGSRLGSSASHEGYSPNIVYAFNGLQYVPIDVIPRVLGLPIANEAGDPAQAQALTLTVQAGGEGGDGWTPVNNDPPSPLGRGPQMLRVVRFELGGGAPDSVEFDIGTGGACTVPSRYARASILDYSADLIRSDIGPDPGRDVPPAVYFVSEATGVRTPSSTRTQIAYVTGEQFAVSEGVPDRAWTAARLFWTPLLARVQTLFESFQEGP